MLLPSDFTMQSKIVLLGATHTGKTSILRRLVFNRFSDEVMPTLGAGLNTFDHCFGDRSIRLNIWDTAGQENYRSLARIYYRDARAAVIVFDVTSKDSFNDIDYWLGELDSSTQFGHYIIILGNKIDLKGKRVITEEQGKTKAERSGATYYEVSALTGEGVKKIFETIAEDILKSSVNVKSQPFAPQNKKRDDSGCC